MTDTLELLLGPLFRACVLLLFLGLLRMVVLHVRAMSVTAELGQPDMRHAVKRGLRYFLPTSREHGTPLLHNVLSMAFHVGILVVVIVQADHLLLWSSLLGIGRELPILHHDVSQWITLGTLATVLALILVRLLHPLSRQVTELRDHLFLGLIGFCLLSGYLAARPAMSPFAWESTLVLHILSGELLLVMIPFSRLGHFVRIPLERIYVAAVGSASRKPETRESLPATEEVRS